MNLFEGCAAPPRVRCRARASPETPPRYRMGLWSVTSCLLGYDPRIHHARTHNATSPRIASATRLHAVQRWCALPAWQSHSCTAAPLPPVSLPATSTHLLPGPTIVLPVGGGGGGGVTTPANCTLYFVKSPSFCTTLLHVPDVTVFAPPGHWRFRCGRDSRPIQVADPAGRVSVQARRIRPDARLLHGG